MGEEIRAASRRSADWQPEPEDLALLALLADGLTIEVVAKRQGVSTRTLRRRLRTCAEALGVDTTMEVVVLAVRRGWI